MTRAQKDLVLAEELVSSLPEDRELRDIYGGLCHSFPVLVRTCGLCQALAFHTAKAAGDTSRADAHVRLRAPDEPGDERAGAARNTSRADAHRKLLDHVAAVLGVTGDPLDAVRQAETLDYMLKTRRVLEAWIYFKRFAVSILRVESGKDAPDA